jgi:hypothetical protein
MKIPKFARILGGVILGFILVGLILPYVVTVDSFRPKIVALMEQKTGRKVSIGEIRARFIPHIGFAVSDVTLGSPANFGDVNLLKVDTIKGALAWGPLLHGDYEVDSLELVHPVVVLAEDERGRTNYDFSASGTGARRHEVNVEKPLELSAVDLSGAELTSGRVAGSQHALVPSLRVSGLDVHLANVTTQAGGWKLWTASIPLSGVKIDTPGIKGPLAFTSGELTLKEGRVDGPFEAALGSALKGKGELHVANIEKPVADMDLSTPLLDLDQLAGAAGASPAAPRSAPAAPGKGELVAIIKAKADRVRYSPYEGTGARADIKLYDNRTEVPLTMNFYGGSLGVTARLDSAQIPERYSANVQLSRVDMEKLLSVDPGTRGKMTGRGELKMQLFGALDKNPLNSLTGQGSFALRDGRLPGVHLGKQMEELKKVEKFLSLGASGGGDTAGETTFSVVEGDLSIRGTRLYTSKTHADTNMGTGDVGGSVGFDQTLDLAGTWHLSAGSRTGAATAGVAAGAVLTGGLLAPALLGAGGASLSVPFTVRGTLKNPQLLPGGGFRGGGSQPSSSQQPTQPQKKSIFDLFKKP